MSRIHTRKLVVDPKDAFAWIDLGTVGGTVKGQGWSKAECYQKTLDHDPMVAVACYNLGNQGGGTVKGKTRSAAECFQNAAR